MSIEKRGSWVMACAVAGALALACGEAGRLPLDPGSGPLGPTAPNFVVSQVGHTTNHNGDPGTANLVMSPPTVSVGDFLIAQVVVYNIGTTDVMCTPDGWTFLSRVNNSSSTAQAMYYKFVQAGDPTSYEWRFKSSAASCGHATNNNISNTGAVGGIIAYSGVDPAAPIAGSAAASGGDGQSTLTVDAPNVDGPFAEGSAVLRFCGNNKEFAISVPAPGVLYNSQRAKNGGGFLPPTGAAAVQTLAADGPTGTLTCSNGGQSANWVAHTIVLGGAADPPPPSNNPPVLSGVPDEPADICELVEYTFTASATDQDNDNVTLSVEGTLPDGATFDPLTGEFKWTPAENQDPGPYTFTIKATDDGNPQESDEQEVTITVLEANVAPVLDAIGNQAVYVGDLLTFTATATDDDLVNGVANTLAYSLEGTVPAGASIHPTTGVFSWTPAAGQGGLHSIKIRVTDNGPDTECGDADLYDEETIVVNVRLRTYFLALDQEAIDKGKSPNNFTDAHVNESITRIGQRGQLAYFAANAGKTIYLPSGQVGDEGWFALKTHPNSWITTGPTTDGFRNLLLAGPGLGGGSNKEAYLDKIANVTPLRATGLKMLIGHQVCAIVWKSDVSINYGPLNGSLKGDNRGIVAFEVTAVTRSGSGSTLPRVTLVIRNATEICAEPLLALSAAPAPSSSSSPMDVVP